MTTIMNQRFNLFRRAGVFYYEDTTTGKQLSLRTKDEAEARTLLNAKNESFRQPVLNRQIAAPTLPPPIQKWPSASGRCRWTR
jgi:hypothetical protein